MRIYEFFVEGADIIEGESGGAELGVCDLGAEDRVEDSE